MSTDFGGRTEARWNIQGEGQTGPGAGTVGRQNQNRTEKAVGSGEEAQLPRQNGIPAREQVKAAPFTTSTSQKVNGGGNLLRGHRSGKGGKGGKTAKLVSDMDDGR